MKKQVINHKTTSGGKLDLNAEMMENVSRKIGASAYIYKEGKYLTFICEERGGSRFTTDKVAEMYAYLCGILNF